MNYQERHWDIIDDRKANLNPNQWVTLAAGFKVGEGIELQWNTRMNFREGDKIWLRQNQFKKFENQPDFVLITKRHELEIDPDSEVVSSKTGGQ